MVLRRSTAKVPEGFKLCDTLYPCNATANILLSHCLWDIKRVWALGAGSLHPQLVLGEVPPCNTRYPKPDHLIIPPAPLIEGSPKVSEGLSNKSECHLTGLGEAILLFGSSPTEYGNASRHQLGSFV